jgi:hypothetical protein
VPNRTPALAIDFRQDQRKFRQFRDRENGYVLADARSPCCGVLNGTRGNARSENSQNCWDRGRDSQSKPIAAVGLGNDARIRSLVADEQWMKELHQRRLGVLNLDRKVLRRPSCTATRRSRARLERRSGDAVLNFIGSVILHGISSAPAD